MATSTKAAVVLKAVKKIVVQFSPFETNVQSTRAFLSMVGSEKARLTNINCEVKPIVIHDNSEPIVDVTFLDGDRLVMKGAHLTIQEMMSAFTTRCIAKDPQGKAKK